MLLNSSQGRSALLNHLKELGVTKLPDRQKLAKLVASAQRELSGVGVPVLVCLYSAGVNAKSGRDLLAPFLAAAAKVGYTDPLVFDHHNMPPYDQLTVYHAYIDKMCEELHKDPSRKARPVVLVAHSHGCVGAFGLAQRLGPRVRHLCCVARRPVSIELLEDVFGVPTTAQIASMDSMHFLTKLVDAYQSQYLKMFVGASQDRWPKALSDSITIAREQYSSRVSMCDVSDIEEELVVPGGGRIRPISTPILALASSQETAQGETRAKMEGWRALTAASFAIESFDVDHMGAISHTPIIEALLAAIAPYAAT